MSKDPEDRWNKRVDRSKYFRKHYIVEEADLEDVRCKMCGCVFAIDWRWITYYTRNLDETWGKYRCPYCGRWQHTCI